MQYLMKKLTISCVVLSFLNPAFSQTTKTSDHPLLDKYYPQKQNTDTAKTVINKPAPVSIPPAKQSPVVIKKVETPKPPTPVPVADTTEKDANTTTVSQIKTMSVAKDPLVTSNVITAVSPPVPQKKPPVAKPPAAPYIDTRLGSSAPQYNTYEKNNNGAGSVTTSPK